MSMKWNALALGLIATLIFIAGKVQAQQFLNVPAEIQVTRDAEVFSLFSNVLNAPTVACKFIQGITISSVAGARVFPDIAIIGTVEPDGSLTVNRQSLLDTLNLQEAVFVRFNTECGSNGGDLGAKGFLARISRLQTLESLSIHTLLFTRL